MLARIQLPPTARRGEVIEVRIAIQHPMETGFRYEISGSPVPKNVINTLVARYNGAEIFRAEMDSQFHVIATRSGEIEFSWVDDAGERGAERAAISVTD
jgi:sulfur-oxidizing protein SoxZ